MTGYAKYAGNRYNSGGQGGVSTVFNFFIVFAYRYRFTFVCTIKCSRCIARQHKIHMFILNTSYPKTLSKISFCKYN